jgi:hypothetical protein
MVILFVDRCLNLAWECDFSGCFNSPKWQYSADKLRECLKHGTTKCPGSCCCPCSGMYLFKVLAAWQSHVWDMPLLKTSIWVFVQVRTQISALILHLFSLLGSVRMLLVIALMYNALQNLFHIWSFFSLYLADNKFYVNYDRVLSFY